MVEEHSAHLLERGRRDELPIGMRTISGFGHTAIWEAPERYAQQCHRSGTLTYQEFTVSH